MARHPDILTETPELLAAIESAAINRPPIQTGPTGAPAVSNHDPYQIGVLPSQLGLQPDLVSTQLKGGPTFRVMPVAPAGVAANNSNIGSTFEKSPTFLSTQAQSDANAAAIAALPINAQQLSSAQAPLSSSVTVSNALTNGGVIGQFVAGNTVTLPGIVAFDVNSVGGLVDVFLFSIAGPTGPSGYFFRFDGRDTYNAGQILKVTNGTWANIGVAKASPNVGALLGWHQVIGKVSPNGQFDIFVDGVWQCTAIDTTYVLPAPTQCYYGYEVITGPTLAPFVTGQNVSVFLGAWSSVTLYVVGNQVDFSGGYYIALTNNLNHQPDTHPADWQLVSSPSTNEFIGVWSSVTAYLVGNQVTYSGTGGNAYYIALVNNTNKQPDTNPSDWQQIGSPNSYVFLGAYNGATAYIPGNQVSYLGSYWICTTASTGNAPGVSSSFWQQVGQAAILLQSWSNSVAYTQGMEALYLGSVYKCILANTNQPPASSPTYWILMSNPASAVGFQVVSNPDFQNGLTNYVAYDNNSTGNITLSVIADTAAPGGFGQKLKINVAGWGENPGLGGFYYGSLSSDGGVVVLNTYHVGDTYIISLWANIPVGYSINFNNNSLGTGGYVTPISASYAGTGGWVNYVWQLYIGAGASANAFPYFYLTGVFSAPFAWYAAQLSITDINQPARGNQNLFLGAYSSGVQYVPGNEVSSGGFYWTCISPSIGNTPPVPPATSAFWLLVGPVSIDPSTPYVLAKGSTPLTQNTGLSYTSTTTSIDLIWDALALYRADNTITTIGTSSQNVTTLGSGLTFYAFPYYNESTATFGFISNSDVTFPNVTGIAFATNQEVTTTTSAALTAAFSVSVWMKVASGGGAGGGLTKNTAQTGAISGINSVFDLSWTSGQIQANYRDSGATLHTLTTPQTYNDGNWHHFVYTCSPATSSQVLYADGVSVATGSVATAVSATSAYYRLVKDFANIFMTGTMTEVSVYNVALTAVQVAAQFNAGNSISQSAFETVVNSQAPTIWWKMTETSGTLADSGSIGGNTGNTTNSPTYNQSSAVFGAVGSPAILWPSRSLLVSQAQGAQSRVPFSVGGWAVATTSGGTGGGSNGGSSGGSGAGCFSGNTLIQTPNGFVAISEIKPGDFVMSYGGVLRKVLLVHRHEKAIRKMIAMNESELVTPNHIIADGNEWASAGEVFKKNPRVQFDDEVFNLSIEGENFNEHSFLLASGVLAHNGKIT